MAAVNKKKASVKLRKDRTKWYKVVVSNGTGGFSSFQYGPYLPQNGQPGKWLELPKGKKLYMCQDGFHVTSDPKAWHGRDSGARVFLVEIEGETLQNRGENKKCCRKIRLTQEVTYNIHTSKWEPKAPPRTYTQSEVTALITNLRQQAINTIADFANKAINTLQ